MTNLTIHQQDEIAEEGAAALLWLGGYEAEAERLGSEGRDW